MYVIQARDLINGTCGSPILAPSIEIAKRQIGRMISENLLLKNKPDGAILDIYCAWDPSTGLLPNPGTPNIPVTSYTGSECLEAFQHALDAINTPGEGEWSADDADALFDQKLKEVDDNVDNVLHRI